MVFAAILLVALSATAIAQTINRDVTATIRYDMSVKLNGELLTLRDVDGDIIQPISIDDTTYLPLRAIAEVLDLDVEWNPDTQTAMLCSQYHLQAQEISTYQERYAALRETTAYLEELQNQLNAELNRLQAQYDALATSSDVDDFPRQHQVAFGENMTRIARIHYGEERVNRHPFTYTEHIRLYNGMPHDSVQLGQTLIIPAPPAQ